MKFTSATIENYRSIDELEIGLAQEGGCYCHILAGINESGKSNILKALSLLNPENKVTYSKDINKKARSEKKNIRVLYRLEDEAIQVLKKHLESKEVPTEIIEQLEIEKIQRVVSFDSASARNDYFFLYLAKAPELDYSFSTADKQFIKNEAAPVVEDEEVPPAPTASATPAATATTTPVTTPAPKPPIALNEKAEWEKVVEDYFMNEALESLIPRVIFWAYSDKYLINQEINLTEFAASPATISKPLHNVFNLANFTDTQISAVITDALADGAQMGELADRLEKAVTNYLEEVWPEHRVSIKVHTSNPTISFHVVEKDTDASGRYEVAERSDGFKHFFAILLNLAAENSTSQLKDCLILLDEPEVHLHPSGAKFLRDELLKIGADNTVVYSTHSIFMIDRSCLDRHFKVLKENEITKLLKIDSSNPFKEELIYEALGTSIFDLISEHNILFEGLTDKKLFEAFTQKFRVDIKPLDITSINVDGESHFDKYCKFFNKKSIKGYIVADSDKDGSAAKTRILRENNPEYNSKNTFEINDIVATGKKSSLEDLIPAEVIQKCIEDLYGIAIVLDDAKVLVEQINDYNKTNQKKIELKRVKEQLADFVCNDITKSAMTKEKTKEKYPVYYEFVCNLHVKLKEANTDSHES